MATTKPKIFRVTGRLTDRRTHQAVRGLQVQVWDKDLISDEPLGSATTDTSGVFSISFDKSSFAELFFDQYPDMFFKVFSGDKLIKSTEDSVLWNVHSEDTSVEIEVDTLQVTTAAGTTLVVCGTVTHADGGALAAVLVSAFDQDLRTMQALGNTLTDANRGYRIEYTHAQLARADKANADLVVEVFRQTKVSKKLLIASSVWFNAPAVATVNLTVPNGNDTVRIVS